MAIVGYVTRIGTSASPWCESTFSKYKTHTPNKMYGSQLRADVYEQNLNN